MSILLTAGYDRALHSIAVAESLRRSGCPPDLILIAYPMTVARVQMILRSRGIGAILRYVGRRKRTDGPSPLDDYLAAARIADRSLRAWARRWDVRCVSVGNINAPRALRYVAALRPKITAYTGGGILRDSFLDAAGRRVFNAHSGPMPMIRGMNACEWSLLLGQPLSVTLHLIDQGIDTGAIISRTRIHPRMEDTLDVIRERCTVAGIEEMVKHVKLASQGQFAIKKDQSSAFQRQCFVLAPALREVLLLGLPDLIKQQATLNP